MSLVHWTIPALFLLGCQLISFAQEQKLDKRIVCYYASWSWDRFDYGKFVPKDINPYICTHIIYAFVGMNPATYALVPFNETVDVVQGGYMSITRLKRINPSLKVMVSLGGWNEGVRNFSIISSDSSSRSVYIRNVVNFLKQYDFDGVDIAWQYPVVRDGGSERDKANYALLMQEFREAFQNESDQSGNDRYILSIVMVGITEYIERGYDVDAIGKYVDFINMVAYDFVWDFAPAVYHHAPLFDTEGKREDIIATQLNIDTSISNLLNQNIRPEQVNLGIPTYARYHMLEDESKNWPGSPSTGGGKSNTTEQSGFIYYYEMCRNLRDGGWTVKNANSSPYAYRGTNWVSFDTPDSVVRKAVHARRRGLGGIMYWTIDGDDFHGTCWGYAYPLILAGWQGLRSPVPPLTPPQTSTGASSPSTISVSTPNVLENTVEQEDQPLAATPPSSGRSLDQDLPLESSDGIFTEIVGTPPSALITAIRNANRNNKDPTNPINYPLISFYIGGSTFYQNISVHFQQ